MSPASATPRKGGAIQIFAALPNRAAPLKYLPPFREPGAASGLGFPAASKGQSRRRRSRVVGRRKRRRRPTRYRLRHCMRHPIRCHDRRGNRSHQAIKIVRFDGPIGPDRVAYRVTFHDQPFIPRMISTTQRPIHNRIDPTTTHATDSESLPTMPRRSACFAIGFSFVSSSVTSRIFCPFVEKCKAREPPLPGPAIRRAVRHDRCNRSLPHDGGVYSGTPMTSAAVAAAARLRIIIGR